MNTPIQPTHPALRSEEDNHALRRHRVANHYEKLADAGGLPPSPFGSPALVRAIIDYRRRPSARHLTLEGVIDALYVEVFGNADTAAEKEGV